MWINEIRGHNHISLKSEMTNEGREKNTKLLYIFFSQCRNINKLFLSISNYCSGWVLRSLMREKHKAEGTPILGFIQPEKWYG
jgi:hypothetical protein